MASLEESHFLVGQKAVTQFSQPSTYQGQRQRLSLGYVLNIATESSHFDSIARVDLIDAEQHSSFVLGRLFGKARQPIAIVECLMRCTELFHPVQGLPDPLQDVRRSRVHGNHDPTVLLRRIRRAVENSRLAGTAGPSNSVVKPGCRGPDDRLVPIRASNPSRPISRAGL